MLLWVCGQYFTYGIPAGSFFLIPLPPPLSSILLVFPGRFLPKSLYCKSSSHSLLGTRAVTFIDSWIHEMSNANPGLQMWKPKLREKLEQVHTACERQTGAPIQVFLTLKPDLPSLHHLSGSFHSAQSPWPHTESCFSPSQSFRFGNQLGAETDYPAYPFSMKPPDLEPFE